MRMKGLERLAQSMRALDVDLQQFLFKNGAASFDCLFSMRGAYELSLTSRGENPKFFLLPITYDFQLSTYLSRDKLNELMNVLRTHGLSTQGFSTSRFFQNLDLAVPQEAQPDRVPTAAGVLSLRHDLEERDRPFFDTWVYWKERGPRRENLDKTMKLLGPEAYAFSVKHRASSKWSADDLKRSWK
ncbi:DUF6037 family protein [Pseudomonas sp. 3A(2025)]